EYPVPFELQGVVPGFLTRRARPSRNEQRVRLRAKVQAQRISSKEPRIERFHMLTSRGTAIRTSIPGVSRQALHEITTPLIEGVRPPPPLLWTVAIAVLASLVSRPIACSRLASSSFLCHEVMNLSAPCSTPACHGN
ncbi:unnamed protein product, partial [Sphacelaria rigidula]